MNWFQKLAVVFHNWGIRLSKKWLVQMVTVGTTLIGAGLICATIALILDEDYIFIPYYVLTSVGVSLLFFHLDFNNQSPISKKAWFILWIGYVGLYLTLSLTQDNTTIRLAGILALIPLLIIICLYIVDLYGQSLLKKQKKDDEAGK